MTTDRTRRAKTGRATIVDVARLSGVSKSTVANVINGTAPIANHTRDRVLAAIEELGYRPNALARDLKRRRTTTVGVLVGDLANPFYAELTKLIERRCSLAGYATIIAHTDGDRETERERLGVLLEQRVSGIVLLYFTGAREHVEAVGRDGVPIVGVSVFDRGFDCVASDDAAGTRLAADHLAALGHERIAYVPGVGTESSTNRARQRGWRQALRAAGLTPGPVVGLDASVAGRGVTTLDAVLADAEQPTAYVAGNDLTALDMIDRLEAEGVRVPRDASVVGFDDIPPARLGRLSLTTVRQPIHGLATHGVERLLARMDPQAGPDAGPAVQRRLPLELIVRGTTASPR